VKTNAKIARAAEEQGYRVRPTRKGWVVYGKDGKSTVGFHRTPSDHRAAKNLRADLKKIGVVV
jgi:hypothetical protein